MPVEDSLICGEDLHLYLWLAPFCGWEANGQHPVLLFYPAVCPHSGRKRHTTLLGWPTCCLTTSSFQCLGGLEGQDMTEAGFDICLALKRFISAVFVSCYFLIISVGTTWFTRVLGLKGENAADKPVTDVESSNLFPFLNELATQSQTNTPNLFNFEGF